MMCEHEKLTLPNPSVCGVETETIAWHPYPEWKPPKSGKYLVTELRYSDTYQEYDSSVNMLRYTKFTRRFGGFFGGAGQVIAWAYKPNGRRNHRHLRKEHT